MTEKDIYILSNKNIYWLADNGYHRSVRLPVLHGFSFFHYGSFSCRQFCINNR